MKNKTKTILFASLIAAMILPFSTMDYAEAKTNDKTQKDKLANDLIKKLVERNQDKNGKRQIPITKIGYDLSKDTLVVSIEPGHSYKEMKQYGKKISQILGSHVKITLDVGKYWKLTSCNNANSVCNPLMGGIQMQTDGLGPCTIGLKATYKGVHGFVTAGHCADANGWRDVGQPTDSNVIGAVYKEIFTKG